MPLPDDPDSLLERLLGRPELTPVEIAAGAGVDLADTRRLWRALGFPPVADDARVFTKADATGLAIVSALLARGEVDLPSARAARARHGARARADRRRPGDRPRRERRPVGRPARARRRPRALDRLRLAAPPRGGAPSARRAAGRRREEPHRRVRRHGRIHRAQPGARRARPRGDGRSLRGRRVRARAGSRGTRREDDRRRDDVRDRRSRGGGGDRRRRRARANAGAAAIRVGLAHGTVLEWEGDLYGPTVNLASRLVNVARPGSVLVAEPIALALEGRPEFVLRRLQPVRLQGIGRVRSWVLRRAASNAASVVAPNDRPGVGRLRRARARRRAPEV